VDLSERVAVVAELGNNHEGDPGVARELVERAADAGAHAVKLQTFEPRLFVRPRDRQRLEQMSRFQLPDEVVEELAALARERDLGFMSTPLDMRSADFLEPLVDAYKVASGDNDFVPLIDRLADSGKPMVISTGLLDLEGVRALWGRLVTRRGGDGGLALLHCVAAYPVPPGQANLAAIELIAEDLGCIVGWSNHVPGIEVSVAAVALGARIVETHFTLDHHFSEFRDHQMSADPDEMRSLVERVADSPAIGPGPEAEVARGRREKAVQPAERELETVVRRSIVAAYDLQRGHRVTAGDLGWMRPRDGLEPGREDELVGRDLARGVSEGESILLEDVA
jgi:N,N'-diacetyllegionaminate synthase